MVYFMGSEVHTQSTSVLIPTAPARLHSLRSNYNTYLPNNSTTITSLETHHFKRQRYNWQRSYTRTLSTNAIELQFKRNSSLSTLNLHSTRLLIANIFMRSIVCSLTMERQRKAMLNTNPKPNNQASKLPRMIRSLVSKISSVKPQSASKLPRLSKTPHPCSIPGSHSATQSQEPAQHLENLTISNSELERRKR
jgi:hypothetical protein